MAENHKEALAKVKDMDFDLIVSDIRMPEINGVEIIQEIRRFLIANGKNQSQRFLLLVIPERIV